MTRTISALALLSGFWAYSAYASEATDIFAKHVLPTLKEKCGGCHGARTKTSGLKVETREDLLRGGKRGAAIIPGDPAKSLLVIVLEQETPLKMPPGQRLSVETIAAFRRWIELGAPWSDEPPKTISKWNYSSDDAWEFRSVKPVPPPDAGKDATVLTPVDAFILAKLREKTLRPAPRADRVTLLRRATYDLTGLPPTPEEVKAFISNAAPDQEAYRNVVERLLASPRYGGKWGRHWLDVVRYADTGGYSNDFERPHAWRYRDYVIRSFNQDKPYNEFVREQIAGDEMDGMDPDKLVATGYLRMGPWEQTGMSVAAETRQAWLDDVTHSIGATFLGLTLECARCHDHKFDPLPTKDYYRLQAVFATTEFADRPAPFVPGEARGDFVEGRAHLQQMIERNNQRMSDFDRMIKVRLRMPKGDGEAAPVSMEALMEAVKTKKLLSGEEFERYKIFSKRKELYDRSVTRYDPIAYAVSDGPFLAKDKPKWTPPEVYILPVGNLKTPGERVNPGLISAAMHYTSWSPDDVTTQIAGRRLALANWIASEKNPLTARVMVNRIWQYHFGRGIAANPNNLGKMGEKPSHPELLDWLANYFVQHGWSVKEMHRIIMLSDAYQRSAEHPDRAAVDKVDPENKLLAYFSTRRLEAEEIRDSMLFTAGELNLDMGGPGTFPEINEDVANQPQQIMGTLMPAYHSSQTKAARDRRTIYTFQKRNLINPFVDVFNGPSLDESTEKRLATTVPTQVFSLFNSRFTHDEALAFALRVAKMEGNMDAEITNAWKLAFNRVPRQDEMKKAEAFLEKRTEAQRRNPPPAAVPRKPVVRSITSELTGAEVKVEEDQEIGPYQENVKPDNVAPGVRALAELGLALFNSNEYLYVY
jgi:hypothetical protein